MEFYEIAALMDYSYLRHKEAWERSRMLAYTIAQVQTKKRLKLEDICKFVWDDQNEKNDNGGAMTQEQLDATFAQMEQMIADGLV